MSSWILNSGLNCCTYGTVNSGISEAGMGSPEKGTVSQQGVIWDEILLIEKACDVGVHCGIDSHVSTITHPFDRSGSDDVDMFIYQHSSSDSAWHSRCVQA